MTIENANQAPQAAAICGERTGLDQDTDYGLFETDDGNKFLITPDFGTKIAIALTHDHLPAFTWLPLIKEPWAPGLWLGPCRLRLTHRLLSPPASLGEIGIIEDNVAMLCRSVDGQVGWIALGTIGDLKHDDCDFGGWAFEFGQTGDTFFALQPRVPIKARPRAVDGQRGDAFALEQGLS